MTSATDGVMIEIVLAAVLGSLARSRKVETLSTLVAPQMHRIGIELQLHQRRNAREYDNRRRAEHDQPVWSSIQRSTAASEAVCTALVRDPDAAA